MDALSRFKKVSSFDSKNRAAARLNCVVPEREQRLHHADASLYDMVPEQARTQPVADAGIYRVKPARYRKP